MTGEGPKPSIFAGIQSLEEALNTFRKEVGEHEHACGQPGGCNDVVISFPNCYLLAYTMSIFHLALARSKEEFWRLQEKSMEEWFDVGLSSLDPDYSNM